ncbi:hypothetical protein GMORB2_1578 [Geosmithia morbida]|uniref:Tyrosine-protein phosphatase non-receptor type 6 n=1 Tax=Geosmithia morbida TaxID=1094350 RepID=A0A9P4YVG6_9HYPO|nr:uncharacterized protein GMORB2_1578 [Geosmithia morbida]KAF4121739.1 hypothetical protein GMORB2_1578 [Geosmithia morbida]
MYLNLGLVAAVYDFWAPPEFRASRCSGEHFCSSNHFSLGGDIVADPGLGSGPGPGTRSRSPISVATQSLYSSRDPIIASPSRKDANPSPSPSLPANLAQAAGATLVSGETNTTSYSADTSPPLHQSIFYSKDGIDVSNSRRTSRRRTGPLSQQSRERAALIRKLGACNDCRRRRVACHPSHHNMTWEDVVNKYHRSHSPTVHDIAPPLAPARPLSPATTAHSAVQHMHNAQTTHETSEMDIDSNAPQNYPGRPPLSEARHRTPLPSGPRLEQSLSLPSIESLKNELQSNASRMLSTSCRSRYTAAHVLLLFWQDDESDILTTVVPDAVKELASVLDNHYHFTVQTKPIPLSSDTARSPWRWLSRELNAFSEERDHRDVLKIVYYAGHSYLDGNREMVLARSKDSHKATTIRWNGIQQILEEACADTLLIMDSAYYPSSKMVRQTGVLELITAATSAEHHEALGPYAFTRTLAELMRTRATRLNPLSAAEVHSILFSSYSTIVRDRNPERERITSFPAPFHTLMSGNSRLPSIFLSPLSASQQVNSPLRSSLSTPDGCPLLHMSIRLADDNVDVDSWNEWLRLMPEGVKDVKVEGPFRTPFR